MIEQAKLYFIPKKREFLKIQPGTGDNLSPKDIAEGYTDYVIWNRFRPECLDIDGELEMECVDSGMLLIKEIPGQARDDKKVSIASASPRNDIIRDILEQAYGDRDVATILLIAE